MNLKQTKTQRRIVILFYLGLIFFLSLVSKSIYINIFQKQHLLKIAKSQYEEKLPLHGQRGDILDRNKQVLAESIIGYSIALNTYLLNKAKNKKEIINILSKTLNIKKEKILKLLKIKGYFIWLKRKIDIKTALFLKEKKLKGVEIVQEPTGKRVYPNKDLASQIIGIVGIDEQGLAGLEYYFDKELKGKEGYIIAQTDGLGRVLYDKDTKIVIPKKGANITLTIDSQLQYFAEMQLKKRIKEVNAKSGSIVIIKPDTGEILALANYIKGQKVALSNLAINYIYEPGSTFKLILAAAALDSGKITQQERFYCGDSLKVGGWVIHNADDGVYSKTGYENVEGMLIHSFNVAAASIGLKIGAKTFYKYIKAFGFGQKTGIEFPGEEYGIVAPKNDWPPIRVATVSFGQGISVTPIQLVRAYCALINGGYLVKPHIIKEIKTEDGKIIKIENLERKKIISKNTSELMKKYLISIVEKGTGRSAQIEGYYIGGKTGTAQVSANGIYKPGAYIGSFIGFIGKEKPKLIILVKIDEPYPIYWGGYVAAPVFKKLALFCIKRYNIAPDRKINKDIFLVGEKK